MGKNLGVSLVAISVVATLASGCGPGGAERAAPSAAAAKGALRVGPAIDVGRAAGALRAHFRASAQGLTANGDCHAFAISDRGAVLLRRVPTPLERRKDLLDRARNRAPHLGAVATGQRLGGRPATVPAPSAALSFETVSVARSGSEFVASGVPGPWPPTAARCGRSPAAASGGATRARAAK